MKFRRILPAFVMAVALTLAGCGGGATDAGAPADEAPDYAEAVLDPSTIHPGSVNDAAREDETSDFWYPDGETDSDYLFFLAQTSVSVSNIGRNLYYCKTHGNTYGNFVNTTLQADADKHAKSETTLTLAGTDTEVGPFDLTFFDDFTAYEHNTDTIWRRAHREHGCKPQSWYDEALSGLIAYRDFATDQQRFVFNEDHTFVEQILAKPGMEVSAEKAGTWRVMGSNVVWLIYENAEDAGYQALDVTEPLGYEEGEDALKPMNQAEVELRQRTWQQEFEIDADGTITAFGVGPDYDADGNLVGYSGTFELTSVEAEAEAAQAVADAQAAAAQAVADARDAGSPYAEPDDKEDLSGVNLDQTPDAVVVTGELEAADFDAFKKAISAHELEGMIIELRGTITKENGFCYIEVENASGALSQKFRFIIVDDRSGEGIPDDATEGTVVGVLWSDRRLYTDSAHVTVA